MPKVKIFLDKGETIEDAAIKLAKALDFHSNGDIHDRQDYIDPAMQDLMDRLEFLHKDMYEELVREVIQEIEAEYENGYF